MAFYNHNDEDGLLLTTTAQCTTNNLAQDDNSISGKILFIDFETKNYKIFSKGHRNPQGLTKINDILTLINLDEKRDDTAANLSHGQKQWLEIGILLIQDPYLLLVDEPVAGMTVQETERTAELLTSLAGERSVVVVEHDMEFVRSIANIVTVLHQGSVLAEGTMNEIQDDPKVKEVYLGSSETSS